MIPFLRPSAAATAALVALLAAGPVRAQALSDIQRGEIERVIRDYLLKNPDLVQEAMVELEKRAAAAEAKKARATIKQHSEALLSSRHQVTLGNPQGDVTLVEFFDYNCGYCKRALSDMMALMEKDPKLKVVLKEFPLLGPASLEASQVSIAVRMQDASGKKYLEFHQKLFAGRSVVDKARALAVAQEVGLDRERIERDLKSDEISHTLEESRKLGEVLGLNGTPSYVIGDHVMKGAVGQEALRQQIEAARK